MLITLLAAAAFAAAARAGDIPLANPSFEDGDLCKVGGNPADHPDEAESPPIPGWSRLWGGQMIQAGRGFGEDGGQILEMGDGATSQIFQSVDPSVTAQPDTIYKLSALAGAPPGQDWIGKGRTAKGRLRLVFSMQPEIRDRETVEFSSDEIVCPGDEMQEYSVSVDSSEHQIEGMYLTVFLQTEGSDQWDNYQVWDRVRLTATPKATAPPR